MHMLHMRISMDIIITLSFFITDFLLSSVLNGVSALDGGIVTLSAEFVNPLFYIPAICKKNGRIHLPFLYVSPQEKPFGIMTAFGCHSLVVLYKKNAVPVARHSFYTLFKNLLRNHTAITAQTVSEITGAYQMALPPTVKASASSAAA